LNRHQDGPSQALPDNDLRDFTQRARADWRGGDPEARRARDALRQALEEEGFRILENEWWRFNFSNCDTHPVLDIPFEALQDQHAPFLINTLHNGHVESTWPFL
jgi:hypothetical protein